MKISEIFYSIQGEGVLTGVPSVFIRTSGCNLRCTWCDTPYTSWTPEGEALEIATILDRVRCSGTSHVVVTGGEPMIDPAIVELARELRAMGQHITIETAGTVFKLVECDLMSISPKLANSTPWQRDEGRWAGQHERTRYQPEVLRQLMALCDYQLKFVVAERDDLTEIQKVIADIGADRRRVLLMPEGVTPEILNQRSIWLAEVCKEFDFRFSTRLHVMLWGDRRGV